MPKAELSAVASDGPVTPIPRAPSSLARAFPIVEHASLANVITMTSVLLGISGLLFCTEERPLAAAICGLFALPCDVFDGMVARRRGTTGAFGATLDTLADATSFCVLPAVIGHALGLPSWAVPFQVSFAMAGIARLARYSEVGLAPVGGRETFEGFPTSLGAGYFYIAAAAALWLGPPWRDPLLVAYYALAAAGMVCGLRVPKKGMYLYVSMLVVPLAVIAMAFKLP